MKACLIILTLLPLFSFADNSSFALDRLYKSVEVEYFSSDEGFDELGYSKDYSGLIVKGHYLLNKKIFLTSLVSSYNVGIEFHEGSTGSISDGVINKGIDLKAGAGYRKRYLSYFFGKEAKEIELSLEALAILKQPYQTVSIADEYTELTQTQFGYEYIGKFKRSVIGGGGKSKTLIRALVEVGFGGRYLNDSSAQFVTLASVKIPIQFFDGLHVTAGYGFNKYVNGFDLDVGILYSF